MSFVNYSSKLGRLGAITFTMNNTSVLGSDGWSFNVKSYFDSELTSEIHAQQSRPDHPPLNSATQIVAAVAGEADSDFRAKHGTPGNIVSDFGLSMINTGAFQAHFNPLSDSWYSALVGSSSTAPVITSFVAIPDTIVKGQVGYLDWQVSGQVSGVSIDQGIGPVQISGRRGVIPTVTTTYKLTARGIGGTSYATATVTVNAATTGDGSGTGAGTGSGTGTGGGTTTPPPPPTDTGSNMTTYLVIGGLAFLGLMAMRN